ncbi:TIR domain-containing protein [Paenibacillus sp. FSL K6-1122]|uniref:TIR domain-containing protein n=1 Tax=Paenibacillus sp. FSL K6-1122 TaxID=2954512 RepID=UPI0030ED180E
MKNNNGVVITGGKVHATNIAGTISTIENLASSAKKDTNQRNSFQFDIGLSFAGEDRSFVEMLFKLLEKAQIRVFYDNDQSSQLIGNNLYSHLAEVYFNKSRYCVVVISEYYMKKKWTLHEFQSIQVRNFLKHDNSIIPIILDDTSVPGITDSIAYLDARELSPKQIADQLEQKLKESGSSL